MNIASTISALKTYLSNLTWNTSKGGTCSFSSVFDYPNFTYMDGGPFVCINDSSDSMGEFISNVEFENEGIIIVSACSNWSAIDKSSDDLKRQEAVLRIREITDILKVNLYTLSAESTLGLDLLYNPTYGEIEDVNELNLYKRDFKLYYKELICRL